MRKAAIVGLLVAYGAALAYVTLQPFDGHDLPLEQRLLITPLASIRWFLRHGGRPMVANVLGNVAVFVPLGLLWPALRDGRTDARRVGLLSAAVSLTIEVLQLASGWRVADIDDVLLNTLGGLVGYGAYLGLKGLLGSPRPPAPEGTRAPAVDPAWRTGPR